MAEDAIRKADGALRYLALDDDRLIEQCAVDCYRSHGPGGQKRNKTSSAVRLRHGPTGLAVIAVEDRSQHVNRRRAVRRLREAIALNVRTAVDPSNYTPSEVLAGCIMREGDLRVGQRDGRYYPVVSELLDVLLASDMQVSSAAERVGVTTAHLVKFLKADTNLWTRVNQLRQAAGLKLLR